MSECNYLAYVVFGFTLLLHGCQSIAERMFMPTEDVREAEYATTEEKRVAIPILFRQ